MSASLVNRGITISDADGRGGVAAVRLQASHGTCDATVGNSGVVIISGDTTNDLRLGGTIKALDNLFRGRTTGDIVYTFNSPGTIELTLTVTDEDGLSTAISFAGQVADFASPVVAVPGGTVNINSESLNNLHGLGFTVTDSDDNGEYATMVVGVNHGSVSISPGNSGTTVTTGNGTTSVTVVGTIPSLVKLLTGVGTGLFRHTPTTVNTTITIAVTDSQGQVGTNTKLLTVGVAPHVTTPSTYLAATSNVNFNVHGKGFLYTDSDASGTQTMVLTTTNGTITVAAGNSGVTVVSGSGGATVNITGTITQLNNLLQGSGTGTIVYKRVPDASETFTVTITDNTSRVGAGSITIVTQTTVTWTGYATATPYATTATIDGFVVTIKLDNLPAAWWSVVSEDGRDIRVTLADNTVLPRHLWRFDKVAKTGVVFARIENGPSPPALRVWVGALTATAPAVGSTNGQYAVYDAAIVQAWWPDGGGSDATANANNLTMTTAVAGDVSSDVGKATFYSGSAYGKTVVAIPNDIPETFLCFVKPGTSGSTMDYVSSVHGTVRNTLGQSSLKVRAKTDIQSGTDHTATASGSLTAASWQMAAGLFFATNDRTAYRGVIAGGLSQANNTGNSTGAAGTDGYILGGLGTDTGAAISVNPSFVGSISLACVLVLTDATKIGAWIGNYAKAFNQAAYWGTWTWAADTVTGL